MTELKVLPCKDPDELLCHYQGERDAQGAFVALDLRNGTLSADYNGEIGTGIPQSVYHGQTRRYAIPVLTADAANQLLDRIRPLAQRIMDDWEEEWKGSDFYAVLGPDAGAAEIEIEALTDSERFDSSDQVCEVSADEWLTTDEEVAALGITGATTDEELDEIAARIAADIAHSGSYGYTVISDLSEYLQRVRSTAMHPDAD